MSAERAAPLRVVDFAVRSAHVAVSVRGATGMQCPAVVAPLHVTGGAALAGPSADIGDKPALVAVVPGRWDLLADDVHQATDGVGAVEQRRGAANDFNLVRCRRVDGHSVVG